MKKMHVLFLLFAMTGSGVECAGQDSAEFQRKQLTEKAVRILSLINDSLQAQQQETLQRSLIVAAGFISAEELNPKHFAATLQKGIAKLDTARLRQEWGLTSVSWDLSIIQPDPDIQHLVDEVFPAPKILPRRATAKFKECFRSNVGLLFVLALLATHSLSPETTLHPFNQYNLSWSDMARMANADVESFEIFLATLPKAEIIAIGKNMDSIFAALRRAQFAASQKELRRQR